MMSMQSPGDGDMTRRADASSVQTDHDEKAGVARAHAGPVELVAVGQLDLLADERHAYFLPDLLAAATDTESQG